MRCEADHSSLLTRDSSAHHLPELNREKPGSFQALETCPSSGFRYLALLPSISYGSVARADRNRTGIFQVPNSAPFLAILSTARYMASLSAGRDVSSVACKSIGGTLYRFGCEINIHP